MGTIRDSSARSLPARARQKSMREISVAPAQWKTPWALERCTPITISAALSARVGETTWSVNAFTGLPERSDSSAVAANVFFAAGCPL